MWGMFTLDERLAADTVELDRWSLCRVLLMNDAGYPWLVLVPERVGLRDLDELSAPDRMQAMDEIVRAAGILRALFRPDKLNIASLGNQVAQLHVHVVARFKTDPAWPRPIWGVQPPKPYTAEALADFRRRFAAAQK
ncbi:MAG: HIT family protein [Rhodospirillales bacterium]|nr:HIT family protein [Rhodospirillales bacterium]